MKAIFHAAQRLHDPRQFLVRGRPQPSPEQPARIEALLAGVQALGFAVEAPSDRGMGPIAAVHSADYLGFLQTIHAAWQQLPGASAEVIPNVHPDRRTATYPDHPVGRAGYHQADTACSIGADTWGSAYWSAQTAVAAADLVLAGAPWAYALCRPPGHHAYVDMAGGFCFLNNSAIAAARCLGRGRRPAVLDIDLHHGNGTQGIFYASRDVLTVSVHVDPHSFYPFYWGHAHERGEGAGSALISTSRCRSVPVTRGSWRRSSTGLRRCAASAPMCWCWPPGSMPSPTIRSVASALRRRGSGGSGGYAQGWACRPQLSKRAAISAPSSGRTSRPCSVAFGMVSRSPAD